MYESRAKPGPEVAIVALPEPGHAGQVYELTGPRLMTFTDAAAGLSEATGRSVEFVEVPHGASIAAAKESGAPRDVTVVSAGGWMS